MNDNTMLENTPANIRFGERRFLLPVSVIIVSALMVIFGFMTGTVFAGLASTLTTGYIGLTGYTSKDKGRS